MATTSTTAKRIGEAFASLLAGIATLWFVAYASNLWNPLTSQGAGPEPLWYAPLLLLLAVAGVLAAFRWPRFFLGVGIVMLVLCVILRALPLGETPAEGVLSAFRNTLVVGARDTMVLVFGAVILTCSVACKLYARREPSIPNS